MSKNKEVISSPDNTNCPDIYLASSNEVISNLIMNTDNQEISFFPTTFQGLSYIDNLVRNYKRNGISIKNKTSKSMTIASFKAARIIFNLISLVLFVVMVVCAELLFFHHFPYSATKLGEFVIGLSIGSLMIYLAMKSMGKINNIEMKIENNITGNKKLFSAKEEKTLDSIEVIDLNATINGDIGKMHYSFLNSVKDIFVLNKDTLQHIDLFPVAQQYDKYMSLYSFLIANQHSISQDLLEKYINQLEDTAEKFNLEVQDVLDLAEKYDKDIEKAQLEKKKLKQKMIDEDAQRSVPVEEDGLFGLMEK